MVEPMAPSRTEITWDPLVSAYLGAAFGNQKFKQIQAAIAVPPLTTCLRINTLKSSPQEVLNQLQHSLPGHSSSFSLHPDLPVAVMLRGSGPNPLHNLAAEVTKEVIISRKAGEAVLRGAQVFVPGVLACSAGLSAGDQVVVTVALDRPGRAHCGITRGTVLPAKDDTAASNSKTNSKDINQSSSKSSQHAIIDGKPAAESTVAAALAEGRLCVGVGRAVMSRTELFRLSHGVAVEMTQRVYDVPSPPLDGTLKGSVMLQNLPSIVAAQVLNPQPGSRVLDMCAAPGGKTTMLAQIMNGSGELIALDRTHAKVDDIKALAAEMGCEGCVQAYRADSTKVVCRSVQQQQQQQQSYQQSQQQQLRQSQQEIQQKQQMQEEELQQQQQQQEEEDGHLVQSCSRKLLMLLQEADADQQHQQQEGAAVDSQQQQSRRAAQQPTHQCLHQQPPPPQQQQQQLRKPKQKEQQKQKQQQQALLPVDTSGLSAKALARMQRRLSAMSARGQSAAAAVEAEYRYYGYGPAKCPGFAPESFDYILLDAPCTALGLRPRLLQPHSLGELLETAAYQRALLFAAVQLLKPGGHLVFSTCSISPAENEVNVRHLLDTYSCLKLIPAQPRIGGPGLTGPADPAALKAAVTAAVQNSAPRRKSAPVAAGSRAVEAGGGVSKWRSVDMWCSPQWLSDEEAAMVQRFDPADKADTIGFFIAKFEKFSSC